jgi:uncharacterized phage-associated protein
MDDYDLRKIKSDEEVKSLIDIVFNAFGTWSASKLTAWSHKDGSPWEMTVSEEGLGGLIADEYIKSYFKRIIHDKD